MAPSVAQSWWGPSLWVAVVDCNDWSTCKTSGHISSQEAKRDWGPTVSLRIGYNDIKTSYEAPPLHYPGDQASAHNEPRRSTSMPEQFLTSFFNCKKPGLIREMAGSETRAGNVQDKPEASRCAKEWESCKRYIHRRDYVSCPPRQLLKPKAGAMWASKL